MLYFAGLGLRTGKLKSYMLDGDLKNIEKPIKCNSSLGGAFEIKETCVLCWAGCWKHTAYAIFVSAELSKTQ